MMAATTIIPNPPICIRIKITSWPKNDQWVAVSTTTRPVTHIAEVEVKIQVKKSVGLPVLLEIGSDNKKAPKKIAIKKLPSIVCVEIKKKKKRGLLKDLFITYIIPHIP